MINCNLCPMSFESDDSLIRERIKIHQVWHTPTKISRNTVMGRIRWHVDDMLTHVIKHDVVIRQKHIICKYCDIVMEFP